MPRVAAILHCRTPRNLERGHRRRVARLLENVMNRRAFLAASLASSAAAVAQSTGTQANPGRMREYYQLRRYSLQSGPQLAATEKYISEALIPALARRGSTPVGAFRLEIGPETPT